MHKHQQEQDCPKPESKRTFAAHRAKIGRKGENGEGIRRLLLLDLT